MPRLSVIMSAYKSGETIEQAVRSTLRAMPTDATLMVVVDGPEAPTENALDRIEDPRLDAWVDPENKGLARQLQILTERVESPLLARMDSDDVCLPWRFRVTLPTLQQADFVFSSGLRFGEGVPTRPSYPLPLDAREVAASLLFYNPLFHPTMACRTSALRRVGSYAAIPYGEDLELWTRAAAQGAHLVKVAAPTIRYRLSANQMSAAEGADQRLLAEPAFRKAHHELAERHGLGAQMNEQGRLVLDERMRAMLVARFRPWNRRHAARQLAGSPLVMAS